MNKKVCKTCKYFFKKVKYYYGEVDLCFAGNDDKFSAFSSMESAEQTIRNECANGKHITHGIFIRNAGGNILIAFENYANLSQKIPKACIYKLERELLETKH